MLNKINKNVILSWAIAIPLGWGLQYLLIMVLPANSPYIWIRWLAVPIALGAQRLILDGLNNPPKDEELS
jgi:hypothetical protein